MTDIRLAEDYQAAQQDQRFLDWLEWHEGALELGFGLDDIPELPGDAEDSLDNRGLRNVEARALALWADAQQGVDDTRHNAAMRFAYFIGEAFAQSFEGAWACTPWGYFIDLPFRTRFLSPRDLLVLALHRRTGDEWSFAYRKAQQDYDQWVAAGRLGRDLR